MVNMAEREILLLSEDTIDKIAAGEVIERPSSVAKELVENAIDAGSTRIVVEIKGGGIDMLRVTDNGQGIPAKSLRTAFLRHATSKIRSAEDLNSLSSLGFRGEALSSILAVSHVECMTKTADSVTGTRYIPSVNEDDQMMSIGAPNGTTFIIRNLFYNTPARLKFLKSPRTEGSYIQELLEKLSMSRPDIAFQLIMDGKVKLTTPGNGSLKDAVYSIYGSEPVREMLEIDEHNEYFSLTGFLGKPVLNRGTRNFETVFVNGRFVKTPQLFRSIENGYHGFLMQHQFPFCVLFFEFPADKIDVNVHPSKTEIRIGDEREVSALIEDVIAKRFLMQDYAVSTDFGNTVLNDEEKAALKEQEAAIQKEKEASITHIEPFEASKISQLRRIKEYVSKDSPYEKKYGEKNVEDGSFGNITRDNEQPALYQEEQTSEEPVHEESIQDESITEEPVHDESTSEKSISEEPKNYVQESLDVHGFFADKNRRDSYKVIGQAFNTYWLIQYEDRLYLMDQHAAHEKVLYERTMRTLANKEMTGQLLLPPVIISLSASEFEVVFEYKNELNYFGYEFEEFGDRDIAITQVPANLFGIDVIDAFHGFLGEFINARTRLLPELILDKIATMSCKAAIKGGHSYTESEARELIDELFTLEDPYHCPHGRPTLITMTQSELEKKFKRIVG